MKKSMVCVALVFLGSQAAPRSLEKPITRAKTQGQETIEKLPDDVRDQLLLANGINALASVGQIICNPHDIPSVKQHLCNVLGSLGSFVNVLIRGSKIERLQDQIEEMSDAEVQEIVDKLMAYFQK